MKLSMTDAVVNERSKSLQLVGNDNVPHRSGSNGLYMIVDCA